MLVVKLKKSLSNVDLREVDGKQFKEMICLKTEYQKLFFTLAIFSRVSPNDQVSLTLNVARIQSISSNFSFRIAEENYAILSSQVQKILFLNITYPR